MRKQAQLAGLRVLAAVPLLIAGCSEAVGPDRPRVASPAFAAAAGSGITLDQVNGTLGERGTVLLKGFNPTNPHRGDAIIATFFWIGPPGIIDSVTDHLATNPVTPVGNTYTLVESASAGGISMATYVATNVQNFPDAYSGASGDSILVVQANLSVPVADGGLLISAWTGVDPVSPRALGAHRSASGSGFSTTVADPGAIPVNAGALAYGVTMSNGVVSVTGPAGFTALMTMSDPLMKSDAAYDAGYSVQNSAGTVEPQWTWYFTLPSTWLASVLALNPAPPPTGDLTVTTTTTGSPKDPDGYTVTVDGTRSQTVPPNGSVTFVGLESGSHSVTLSGVAVNCAVNGANPQAVTVPAGGTTTASFTVSCLAAADRMTGGGRLGETKEDEEREEFVTFGFEAGPTRGKIEWVQHCEDGVSAASPACSLGSFTFHGTLREGTYRAIVGSTGCRTWSGTGSLKVKDARSQSGTYTFTVNAACDNGQPGRGRDYVDITFGDYRASGYLTGGNIHLRTKN